LRGWWLHPFVAINPRGREQLYWYIFPLFSRVKKENTLDHFLRGQIVQLVRQNPGITVSQILSHTDVNRSTLLYHLSILQRYNYVSSKVKSGYRRFYSTGTHMGEDAQFSTPTADKIWKIIQSNPGIGVNEIAEIADTTRQALHLQLSRLQLDNRIYWQQEGRIRCWYVQE